VKNLSRPIRCGGFLFVLIYLFTCTHPLHAQWIQTNGPYGGVTSFVVSPDGAGGTNLFAANGSGVYLSTNDGTSWIGVNTGLTNTYVYALAVSPAAGGTRGTNLFAGTANGVFLSTNSGTSWTAVNLGLTTGTPVYALAVLGTNLFAGGSGGIFLSTNNGTSWTAVNTGSTNNMAFAFAVSGANLFAGTGGGVFLSSNNGTSWTAVHTGSPISAFAVSPDGAGVTNLFAGSEYGDGVFLSTNNGTSWAAVNSGLTNTSVRALAIYGMNLFTGTQGGGVFLSTNNGTSWTAVNSGLTSTVVLACAVSGRYLFAGTESGAWRRPLSEIITSVLAEGGLTDLPTHSSLGQNYPNPFNPSTIISFAIPARAQVSLKVFDITGREVSTLVSEELSAGNYSRTWNSAGLPSGAYFYRLVAGSFTETRKLVLLR
jgi:hypothetical protein